MIADCTIELTKAERIALAGALKRYAVPDRLNDPQRRNAYFSYMAEELTGVLPKEVLERLEKLKNDEIPYLQVKGLPVEIAPGIPADERKDRDDFKYKDETTYKKGTSEVLLTGMVGLIEMEPFSSSSRLVEEFSARGKALKKHPHDDHSYTSLLCLHSNPHAETTLYVEGAAPLILNLRRGDLLIMPGPLKHDRNDYSDKGGRSERVVKFIASSKTALPPLGDYWRGIMQKECLASGIGRD